MSVGVSPFAFYDALLTDGSLDAVLRREDGQLIPLGLERWLGPTCPVDEAVAEAAVGPVLDIGCGPGRLLDALARRGKWAVGVDLSPAAVGLVRRRGRQTVLGSVFDELPGAEEWATALLLDGSIGIGGDPAALMARMRRLLKPGGEAICEVEAPGAGSRAGKVRLERGEDVSCWFEWAHVDLDGIEEVAAATGMSLKRSELIEERWFAWLV